MGVSKKVKLYFYILVPLISMYLIWSYTYTYWQEYIPKIAAWRSTEFRSPGILIIGATSYLGFNTAVHLHDIGYRVKVVEAMINPLEQQIVWERWKSLHEKNMSPSYIDFNNTEKSSSLISNHAVSYVLLIPPVYDCHQYQQLSRMSVLLKNFIKLLEVIQIQSTGVRIILFSQPEHINHSIEKAWLTVFEKSLVSYHSLYGLKSAVIRVLGPHQIPHMTCQDTEAEKIIYFKDIYKYLSYSFAKQESFYDFTVDYNSKTNLSVPMKPTTNWSNHGSHEKVVMTTYFNINMNREEREFLEYMKPWFFSIVRFGLKAVIFHNDLSLEFQTRIKNYYYNVDFVKVPKNLNGRSPNDARYYYYYQYLLSHSEINSVVATDVKDVFILSNPFEIMEVIGDFLYAGHDKPHTLNTWDSLYVRDQIRVCYGITSPLQFMLLHPLLNAGVVGGSRHVMLGFLSRMLQYLNESSHKKNCNMAIFALITHTYFLDHIFSGYPFQATYKCDIAGPVGMAIKHKR